MLVARGLEKRQSCDERRREGIGLEKKFEWEWVLPRGESFLPVVMVGGSCTWPTFEEAAVVMWGIFNHNNMGISNEKSSSSYL